MVDFASLKRNRESKFESLKEQVTKKASFINYDEKCWKPTTDKTGKGYAVIRFLPAPVFLSDEERDYVEVKSFNMKRFVNDKPRYYIENSLQTIGADSKPIAKEDPANTLKWALWNLGDKESKDLSRFIKNRTQYYANILVKEDPAAPDNEGKVFPYKFGAQIFEKIQKALAPDFPTDPVFNPFDLWEGRDFIVKVVIDPGTELPTYEHSSFAGTESALADSDDEIERVWMAQESILQWVGKDRFKSEEDLKKRLRFVLGFATIEERDNGYDDGGPVKIEDAPAPEPERKAPPARRPEPRKPEPEPEVDTKDEESLDDDDAFLKAFGNF